MRELEVIFTLDESFGPLEKRAEGAIIVGEEHGYSNESIVEIALSEYDVIIRCWGEKVFNATVHFNEFLYELLRFAFYATVDEIPDNVKSYGWSFNGIDELPNWLDREVRTLKDILREEFNELTSNPFLRSFLGSYDPRLVVYGFRKKDRHIYFVSVDYQSWIITAEKRPWEFVYTIKTPSV